MNLEKPHNPLAITLAIISIMFQLVVWVWYGGRSSQRQDDIEHRQSADEAQIQSLITEISTEKQDVAVLSVKLDAIKEVVDAINRKQDARR